MPPWISVLVPTSITSVLGYWVLVQQIPCLDKQPQMRFLCDVTVLREVVLSSTSGLKVFMTSNKLYNTYEGCSVIWFVLTVHEFYPGCVHSLQTLSPGFHQIPLVYGLYF